MSDTHLSLSAPTQNLYRLMLVRGLLILLLCATLVFAYIVLDLPLPYTTLMVILLGIVCINFATWLRLNRPWPVTEGEFFSQLLIDIISITLLLFFCGGAGNPFISYYLVPLCISAATLAWRYTWTVAALSLTAYTLLLFFHIPIPDLAPPEAAHNHNHSGGGFNLHIWGMWVNFFVSAILITYFVVKMASALRQQEEQLSFHREENLRNEQVMAVATLAAGTAHELSTPLSTMKILVTELQSDLVNNNLNRPSAHHVFHNNIHNNTTSPSLSEDLQLLQNQIDQCSNALRSLVDRAQLTRDAANKPEPVGEYCRQLLDKWLLMRPEVSATVRIDSESPQIAVAFPPTIAQSIINLLNNAADANPVGIGVDMSWSRQLLTMQIVDRGPGVPAHLAKHLGKPFFTTKGRGWGLGLFLSHATLSRYKGTVRLYNRKAGGTLTELQLPLAFATATEGKVNAD